MRCFVWQGREPLCELIQLEKVRLPEPLVAVAVADGRCRCLAMPPGPWPFLVRCVGTTLSGLDLAGPGHLTARAREGVLMVAHQNSSASKTPCQSSIVLGCDLGRESPQITKHEQYSPNVSFWGHCTGLSKPVTWAWLVDLNLSPPGTVPHLHPSGDLSMTPGVLIS